MDQLHGKNQKISDFHLSHVETQGKINGDTGRMETRMQEQVRGEKHSKSFALTFCLCYDNIKQVPVRREAQSGSLRDFSLSQQLPVANTQGTTQEEAPQKHCSYATEPAMKALSASEVHKGIV